MVHESDPEVFCRSSQPDVLDDVRPRLAVALGQLCHMLDVQSVHEFKVTKETEAEAI